MMRMRVFLLVLASLLSLCAPVTGWAAAASQDPRSTITGSSPIDATSGTAVRTPAGSGSTTGKPDAPPPEPPLEFQSFVSQASGLGLPVYGHDFFARASSSMGAPLEDAPLSADYVIGPGDEVLIRAWGQVDIDYRAKVDRAGNINVPKVGVLHVAGTEYRQLNAYLRTAISRVFRNFELNVSLGELRSIQVFVVGHARYPGTYLVSSMSTVLSALFATGGPSNKGSLRRIYLRRNNQVVAEFDLYDFLLRGDKSRDMRLLPGDVIQIPPVGGLAAVVGSINTQAIFELKKGESLADLLGAAGGLTTTAAGQKVTLERIVERTLRKVEEFTLDTDGLARQVRDGDIVRVYAISPRIENVVTLRGNVATPANVPWRKGMRISDLIPERAALLSPDYWNARNAAVREAVGRESAFKPRVTGELNWNYAVIERMHPTTQAVTLIPFNLAKAVLQRDPSANLVLEPGDVVTVFGREDLRQPVDSNDRFVRLEGEVRAPGLYRLLPGETARQLVKRLGGVTPNAYLFGAELTRASALGTQQKRLDELLARLDVQMSFETVVASRNNTGEAGGKDEADIRKNLLESLRKLPATGRVLLHLEPSIGSIEAFPDFPLEDGDRLYFPPVTKTINVVGAVLKEMPLSYQPGLGLSGYLDKLGGMTKEADTSAIYVQRADGSVWSRHQSFWPLSSVSIMPGDTIVVPYETDRTLWRKFLRDWAQIFYQFGISVAAIHAVTK